MSLRLLCVGFDELPPRLAYDTWRLRQQVFVVEQASPYPDLDARDLEPTTRQVLLYDNGALVGCLRLLVDDPDLRIGLDDLGNRDRDVEIENLRLFHQ